MPSRTLAALLALLVCVPAQAVDKQALLDQLADASATKRQVAYASIEEGPGARYRSAALTLIARLHKQDARDYEALTEALTRPLPVHDSRGRKSLQRLLDKWDKYRPQAAWAVMDETSFPSPGPTDVMRGPWKGAGKVKSAMKSARKAFDALDAKVGAALAELGSAEPSAAKGAEKMTARLARIDALKARLTERAEVLTRHRRRPTKVEFVDLTFFRTALVLWQGKFDEARQAREALTEPLDKALAVSACRNCGRQFERIRLRRTGQPNADPAASARVGGLPRAQHAARARPGAGRPVPHAGRPRRRDGAAALPGEGRHGQLVAAGQVEAAEDCDRPRRSRPVRVHLAARGAVHGGPQGDPDARGNRRHDAPGPLTGDRR